MIEKIYKSIESSLKTYLSIDDANFFRTQKDYQTGLQHKAKLPRASMTVVSDSVQGKRNGMIYVAQLQLKLMYAFESTHDFDSIERISQVSGEIVKIKNALLTTNDMKNLASTEETNGIENVTDIAVECVPVAHNEKKIQYLDTNIAVFYSESY